MAGDSGAPQPPNPVTGTPLFMSDGEDANDHGEIDERDRAREPPALAFATPEMRDVWRPRTFSNAPWQHLSARRPARRSPPRRSLAPPAPRHGGLLHCYTHATFPHHPATSPSSTVLRWRSRGMPRSEDFLLRHRGGAGGRTRIGSNRSCRLPRNRRRTTETCSPVLGFAPSFSYDSQRHPVPRFCQLGRSLKLMPCWKRSSFFSATVLPCSWRVASPTVRPALRRVQYAHPLRQQRPASREGAAGDRGRD